MFGGGGRKNATGNFDVKKKVLDVPVAGGKGVRDGRTRKKTPKATQKRKNKGEREKRKHLGG